MRRELNIFFAALMFYTRVPVPAWAEYDPVFVNRATRYFPIIGWLVGGVAALVVYGLSGVFPASVCVVLSMIVSVLMTGGFHEDGFADTCDGFGGGWTQERILTIMKDSRIGVFGAVGLVLLLLLKYTTTAEMVGLQVGYAGRAIVLAHVLSRFTAATVIRTHDYARADATSKVKPVAKAITTRDLLIGGAFTLPTFLLFDTPWVLLTIPLAYLTKGYLAAYFQKWIGGYTGDCLGATQQIVEVAVLLYCLALCAYT